MEWVRLPLRGSLHPGIVKFIQSDLIEIALLTLFTHNDALY